jgi:hypothetical protein
MEHQFQNSSHFFLALNLFIKEQRTLVPSKDIMQIIVREAVAMVTMIIDSCVASFQTKTLLMISNERFVRLQVVIVKSSTSSLTKQPLMNQGLP